MVATSASSVSGIVRELKTMFSSQVALRTFRFHKNIMQTHLILSSTTGCNLSTPESCSLLTTAHAAAKLTAFTPAYLACTICVCISMDTTSTHPGAQQLLKWFTFGSNAFHNHAPSPQYPSVRCPTALTCYLNGPCKIGPERSGAMHQIGACAADQ